MKRVKLIILGMMLGVVWLCVAFADDSRFDFYDKAVRDKRFVFHEMTVKDKRTGLIWTRDANIGKRDSKGAFDLVEELNQKKYAGFKDWRLPDNEELRTLWAFAELLGYSDSLSENYRPYILFNKMGFYDVQPDFYWSSSSIGNDSTALGEYLGYKYFNAPITTKIGNVWPVRGGH